MSYILIEESAFKRLMERITGKEENNVRYDFTEVDYWMNGKEVYDYLQVSKAVLNAYRWNNTLCYCRIKGLYHYKRSDVYKLKALMDKELVESGLLLGECAVIDNEEQAYSVLNKNNRSEIKGTIES